MLSITKKLPDYAADIVLNLNTLFEEHKTVLHEKQIFGIALSVAYSIRHEQLLNGIRSEAKMHLEDVDARACKIASTVMSLANGYHRFVDLSGDEEYRNMELGLSMASLKNHQVEQIEMDLYCLAVSIYSGCEYCVKTYIKKVLEAGMSKEAVRDVAKIVAILQATVSAIEIERMRSYDFVIRDASMDQGNFKVC